jgi:tRNA A37 threonylcarbamoyladenosine synthetase subunit TsaC/SUA5/YrdC
MTILPIDAGGLAATAADLRAGEPVLIPAPTPLPYVVAGTRAEAVNLAKGRPERQPCGVLVADVDALLPQLDLDEPGARLARWISRVERANLLVPISADAPAWLGAAAADGLVGITSAWIEEARPLAREFDHLFVSSANLTRGPVATTAAAADRVFGGRRLVLDGDPLRDPGVEHGSAAILEVGRGGALRLVREGVNGRSFTDPGAYLDDLRARFAATERG